MRRLFLGLEIPEPIKISIEKHLWSLQQSPKGWELSHDYHVTLLFIGETPEDQLTEVQTRLSGFRFDPFFVSFNSFQFFNRRVMYLGVEQSDSLLALKEQVDKEFLPWVKPQTKSFLPHVTVKRWQRYEYADLEAGVKKIELGELEFLAEKLALFESKKNELHEKYHVLLRSG